MKISGVKISGQTLKADLTAGLTTALVGIPSGMAYALVAGINPAYGLYTAIVATIVAGFTTGSSFLNVALTSALALTAGSTLNLLSPDQVLPSLFMLTLLVGIIQLIAGLLKLGSLTRFVSNSVLIGFISGVAVLIFVGQLGYFTGYESTVEGSKFLQVFDLLKHIPEFSLPTISVGVFTIVVIVIINRTKLKHFSLILALISATVFGLVMKFEGVAIIQDVAAIPNNLPSFSLPNFSLAPGLIVSALAVAILGLVESAAISENTPEPDGKMPSISKDFRGQGLANVVGSLFQGMPAGGSFSGTFLNLQAGAKTRLANIFAGVIVVIVVLALGKQVEFIPMAAMAGLLIFVAIEIFNVKRIKQIWRSPSGRLALLFTFGATLLIPLHYAIFLGVAVSLIHYLYTSTRQIRILELVRTPDGKWREQEIPQKIQDNQISVIITYGDIFFGSVYALEHKLSVFENSHNAIMILTLRGKKEIGSTFLRMLERFVNGLDRNKNTLILAGVDSVLKSAILADRVSKAIGKENIIEATPIIGESLDKAWQRAQSEMRSIRD